MRRDIVFDNRRQLDIPIKVVRFLKTHGLRINFNDARMVSNFILLAPQDQDIAIFGDGSQPTCFCYVDDLIDETMRMIDTHPKVTGAINIDNPGESTVQEPAELVIEPTASKSKLPCEPFSCDDPRQSRPDISKAKAVIGWEPKIELQEGLIRTITYFERMLSQRTTPALSARDVN